MTLDLAVFISGRGSNLRALLDACQDPAFPARVSVVISNERSAGGLSIAEAAGVPAHVIPHRDFTDRTQFEGAVAERLGAYSIDLICLAGFMRLLSARFVEAFADKIINIHPSLLPAFKGLNTHARALEAGVRFTGCTVHFVRAAMDDGPIIAQAAVPVQQDDTEESLAARVLRAEHALYPMAVRMIAEKRLTLRDGRVSIAGGAAPIVSLFNPAA